MDYNPPNLPPLQITLNFIPTHLLCFVCFVSALYVVLCQPLLIIIDFQVTGTCLVKYKPKTGSRNGWRGATPGRAGVILSFLYRKHNLEKEQSRSASPPLAFLHLPFARIQLIKAAVEKQSTGF